MTSRVQTVMEAMETCVPKPGAIPVRLYGGPYDGCTSHIEGSMLLKIIRADGALCAPVSEDGTKVAAYRIQSDGPLYQGVDGFFRGYANYLPDPVDCGG